MAFESVRIQSRRNGGALVPEYRNDLAAGDSILLSLTSTIGISSVQWFVKGRPEGSSVGGAGPEPCLLSSALTGAFIVDSDDGAFHKDGTYTIEAVINPGSPGEVRKTTILCRLTTGLTVPGPGSTLLPLRKLGGFEGLEDQEVIARIQGWANMLNRWLEWARLNASGGGGNTETIRQAYQLGATGTDQTLPLTDVDGGGVVLDATGAFTGASAFRVTTPAGGPVVVDRATGNIGKGTVTPTKDLHIAGSAPSIRLARTGGATLDLAQAADNIDFLNASTVLARIFGTGGLRSDVGFAAGTNPSGGVVRLGSAPGAAVSGSNEIALRSNVGALEKSENGGAWSPISGGTAFVTVSVTNIATQSILVPFMYVSELDDFVAYKSTSTQTVDNITVFAALGGVGRWERQVTPSAKWRAQFTWSVDPVGGSDTATGVDDAHPLRTVAEWRRRVRGVVYPPNTQVTIRLLGHVATRSEGIFDNAFSVSDSSSYVAVVGVPIVLAQAGTLTSVQNNAGGSDNTRWTVTDSTVPTSWTASDSISGIGASGLGTNGGRMMVAQAAGWRAEMISEPTARTAMIGIPTDLPTVSPTSFTTNTHNPQVGDAYRIEQYPRFPKVQYNGQVTNSLRFVTVEFYDAGGTVRIQSNSIRVVSCFINSAFLGMNGGYIADFVKCGFIGGFGINQPFSPHHCSFMGKGGGTCQMTDMLWDWNTLSNLFKCNLDVNHEVSFAGSGTLYFYDNTGTNVSVDRDSQVLIDAMRGDGNSGKLVTTARNGSWAAGLKSTITCTTSDAAPFNNSFDSYTADDLPIGGMGDVPGLLFT